MKINYELKDDYLLPCLTLNDDKTYELGVYANRHKKYLKENHRIIYYNLLTSNKLNSYLNDIEKQAQDYYQTLIKSLAEKENVTEELKANDMMLWVQKMNNIKSIATEIVNKKIIYNY